MSFKTVYPPELSRHQAVAVGSCLLLTLAGVIALHVGLSDAGRSSKIGILFGVVALGLSAYMVFVTTSWCRKAAQLVSAGVSFAAEVSLVSVDEFGATVLYADIVVPGRGSSIVMRRTVLTPRWDYSPALGLSQKAELFVEPGSSLPMAISTPAGMLWCLPHNSPLEDVLWSDRSA